MKKYQLLKDQLGYDYENINDENEIKLKTIDNEIDKLTPNSILMKQIPDISLYPVINDEINKLNEKIEIWQNRINQKFIELNEVTQEIPHDSNYIAILCGENVTYFINKTTV